MSHSTLLRLNDCFDCSRITGLILLYLLHHSKTISIIWTIDLLIFLLVQHLASNPDYLFVCVMVSGKRDGAMPRPGEQYCRKEDYKIWKVMMHLWLSLAVDWTDLEGGRYYFKPQFKNWWSITVNTVIVHANSSLNVELTGHLRTI